MKEKSIEYVETIKGLSLENKEQYQMIYDFIIKR